MSSDLLSIPFVKYHGAGNDFIMIDDRSGSLEPLMSEAWIAHACHRRFGIGADGLILVQPGYDGADFFMRYYNSDGRTSSFCGNGGRCIVAYAAALGMHNGSCRFLGTDGWHEGKILPDSLVSISMKDVDEIKMPKDDALVLHTGSPHYVAFSKDISSLDVFHEGRTIRSSPPFKAEGINVNFVELHHPGEISIRTYERGVEDETYACGTGVVAAVIAAAFKTDTPVNSWAVHAQGGDLRVDFDRRANMHFTNVWLTGPAEPVFKGAITL